MSNFNYSLNKLLAIEGGYTNNPADYGNYNNLGELIGTKYGITSNIYKAYFGYNPTIQDMKEMTTYEAGLIYKDNFWNSFNLESIINKDVASAILDTLVLFSPKTQIKLLPFNLNLWSYNNLRIEYINSIQPGQFLKELVQARINFHNSQVQKDATQSIFLKGWINRANKLNPFSTSASASTKILSASVLVAGGLLFLFFATDKKKKK